MSRQRLKKIFERHFKIKILEKNFDKMSMDNIKGWDSLSHVNLLIKIEKEFDIKFNTQEFFLIKNVKNIIDKLKNK